MNRLIRSWAVASLICLTVGALVLFSTSVAAQSLSDREVLNLDEAAELLRVQPEVVQALAESHRIPARRVGDVWRFGHAALLEWLKGDKAAGATSGLSVVSGLDQPQTLQSELPDLTARGLEPRLSESFSQSSSAASSQAHSAQTTVGERPATPTTEDIALRDQRVLLGRGAATIEFGASYGKGAQSLLPVVRLEEKDVGVTGTLRYGLMNDLQLTMQVPAIWRRTTSFTDASVSGSTSAQVTKTDDGIASDASISLLGVGWRESMRRPTVVWSLDGVVPTGTGDRAVGGGLVLSKSYDPAVLFTGLSYVYGLHVNPADSRFALAKRNYGFQVGYTYAVNETLALTTAFLGTYRNFASPDGVSIPPPRENYALQLGTTWLLSRSLFMEPAVAVSLGGDNPGLTLSLDFSRSFRWRSKP